MKIIYTLTFLLIAFAVYGQEIPKRANTIGVAGLGFDNIQVKLIDAGYFIDKKDSAFGTIVTMPKQYKTAESIIIRVRVRSDSAFFTGLFNQNIIINNFMGLGVTADYRDFMTVEKYGMKGSAYRNAFDVLNNFALSFGKPVSYKKI